jgi:hypothetical protein
MKDIFSQANKACVSPDRIAELINPTRLSATLNYYSLQKRLNDAGGVNVPSGNDKVSITISSNGTDQLPTVEHRIPLSQLKAHASTIDGQIVLTSQKCWDPVATLLSGTESALDNVVISPDGVLVSFNEILESCLGRLHLTANRERLTIDPRCMLPVAVTAR